MSFDSALAFVLKQEGGYVSNPSDHGGATNQGITQAVYSAWLDSAGLADKGVREIMPGEVSAIYRHEYWLRISGDFLPEPLDLVCFDSSVNCGVEQASKWLQRAVGIIGADVDGHVGPKTLAAVSWSGPIRAIAENVLNQREAMCEEDAKLHPSQRIFLPGWEYRIAALRQVVSP